MKQRPSVPPRPHLSSGVRHGAHDAGLGVMRQNVTVWGRWYQSSCNERLFLFSLSLFPPLPCAN